MAQSLSEQYFSFGIIYPIECAACIKDIVCKLPVAGDMCFIVCTVLLKGLSHEIDFKNLDENGQILALLRAAAGF